MRANRPHPPSELKSEGVSPSQELFAWEGFSFFHPDDWAPVTLAGTRKEGYVRLQGSGRLGCQVRWTKSAKGAELSHALESYFRLLERDAKRAKTSFQAEKEAAPDEGLRYRWLGQGQGRGELFRSQCGRTFFVEVTGGRSDSILPMARRLRESFQAGARVPELWSLLGLRVALPARLPLTTRTLQSGRTWLTFRSPHVRLEVGRFGLGKELAARHGLEPWARAALRLERAEAFDENFGLRLTMKTRLGRDVHALVRLDPDRNQILCIRAATNRPQWIPEWHWLVFDGSLPAVRGD